jgi:hypothetical protein
MMEYKPGGGKSKSLYWNDGKQIRTTQLTRD